MDNEEFERCGQEMLKYITDYHRSLETRDVVPSIEPGYLRKLMPTQAPEKSENFDEVLKDVEQLIMPGVTHWQSPNFFAYFPGNTSYPAILADMLTGAMGGVGFSWLANPAMTELEAITMDWLGKAIGLPEQFFFWDSNGRETGGGGVIQGTASEATCVMLLSAREKALRRLKAEQPDIEEDHVFLGKMVAYASEQVHFSFQKACIIASIKSRSVPTDDVGSMRGEALKKAIEEDKAKGLVPIFVLGTLGTTPTCAFDNLEEVGAICEESKAWLHVDAAYAGAAFVCPEYRHYMKGVELADSFNFNPHKNLMVTFDCSALWVKHQRDLVETFCVDSVLVDNPYSGSGLVKDYRHWQIPLGRRFRSLKLWFVLRCYGTQGLQRLIRERIQHAVLLKEFVLADERFEIAAPQHLGLVCFRLKGENEQTQKLFDKVQATKKVFLSTSSVRGVFMIRFATGSLFTKDSDIRTAWELIQKLTAEVLPASS